MIDLPVCAEPAVVIGIDRSDSRLDICLQQSGQASEYLALDNTPEVLAQWLITLHQRFEGQCLALCFEQPAGALLHQLADCHFVHLYAINPLTLARYRQTFTTSRAKDDRRDARCLMELVRDHRDKLTPWQPDASGTRALCALVEARRQTVDWRTQLCNRLKTHLKSYFPQALQLVGDDLHTPLCCDFLQRWPILQDLKRARPQTVHRFYTQHHSRRHEVIERRLQLIHDSVPVSDDKALLVSAVLLTQMLVGQLKQLAGALAAFDAQIEELFDSHQDAFIFESLPGAGAVYQARLLAAFGSDRTRFTTAQDMEQYSGIAPVVKQSGQSRIVQRRHACPRFLHQSLLEYAGQSVAHCAWAKAYYRMQREKGKGHWATVRALAFKWIRIIFRCWQSRKRYEEERYLAALQRSHAPLLAYLPAANSS